MHIPKEETVLQGEQQDRHAADDVAGVDVSAVVSPQGLTDVKSTELTALFNRYRKALKLFVMATVKCEQTAEEIAQESYLRFLRVQSEKVIAHPRAYLFRTATNLSTDFLRRGVTGVIDTKTEVDEDKIASQTASPEDQAILQQTKQRLEQILTRMPRKTRQVFYYRRYEGYSIKEISYRMNISERMVYKHMRQAMQRLASGLASELEGRGR